MMMMFPSFDARGDFGGGGAPEPVANSLDAPVASAQASNTRMAFSPDQVVEGYSGNTMRLKRLSDSQEADFGTDDSGLFDKAAADTWRSGADVDLVKFYDQKGGALELVCNGSGQVVRSNQWFRFGNEIGANGQLTRSASNGGVAVNFTGNGGYLRVASSGLTLSLNDLEFFLLFSNTDRKKSSGDSADPVELNANNTRENILSYGDRSINAFNYYIGGGPFTNALRMITASSGQDVTASNGVKIFKAKAQQVHCLVATTASGFGNYTAGRKFLSGSYNGGQVSTIAAGGMDNKEIVIGSRHNSGASNAVDTSNRLNGLFGGLIVTGGNTSFVRRGIMARLNQVGQQHRRKSVSDILGYFEDVLVMADSDMNGLVAGKNGNNSVQFNLTQGTPSQEVGYAVPDVGVTGVRSNSNSATDNSFVSSGSVFVEQSQGTMLAISSWIPTAPVIFSRKW